MLRIVLIRPGSTDYDRQGRIQGTLELPLSDQGRQEVSDSIEGLKAQGIQCLYTSPSGAALETAKALSGALGVKLKTIDKLSNLDQGLWQGMLIDDVRTKHPKLYRKAQQEPEHVCPPEGETPGEARERVEQVIGKLLKKHKDTVIGLVVPEPLTSVIRSHLRAESMQNLWKRSDCGTWESIELETKSPVAANR